MAAAAAGSVDRHCGPRPDWYNCRLARLRYRRRCKICYARTDNFFVWYLSPLIPFHVHTHWSKVLGTYYFVSFTTIGSVLLGDLSVTRLGDLWKFMATNSFSKVTKNLVTYHVVSCCVYDKPQKIMQHKHGNIPLIFDCLADLVVHLLLLKSSMTVERLNRNWIVGVEGERADHKTTTTTVLIWFHSPSTWLLHGSGLYLYRLNPEFHWLRQIATTLREIH